MYGGEAYLLGVLPLRKAVRIDEHVLACPECVDTAKELEEYIRAMREALGSQKTIVRKARPG
jgi:hypothetical protein